MSDQKRPWEVVGGGPPPANLILEAALSYAKKGWRVFPCVAGHKHPATEHGVKDATVDELQIRRWWGQNAKYNIGIATGAASGIVVVDVDVKDGKPGRENAKSLDVMGVSTLVHRTPSGGWHYFFEHPGDGPVRSDRSLAGVDIQSEGVYVVAPPSIVDGEQYEAVQNYDVAAMPDTLIAHLERGRPQSADVKSDILPTSYLPEDLKRLRSALAAIDADDYHQWARTGMALYADSGGSDDGFALWDWYSQQSGKYNPKGMRAKWQSFATNRADKVNGETVFYDARLAGWQDSEQALTFEPAIADDDTLARYRVGLLDKDPPEPEFLIEQILPKGKLTLVDGHGGVGKSMLTLQMAVSIATGAPLLGKYEVAEPGASVFLTTEDDATDLARRIKKIREQAEFTPEQARALESRCYVIPWNDNANSKLSAVDNRGMFRATETYAKLEALLKTETGGLKFVMLDPVVSLHGGDENASGEVRDFCQLMKRMMSEVGTTLAISHHMNKSGQTRGSTDWVNACRNRLSLAEEKGELILSNDKRNGAEKMRDVALKRADGGVLQYSHEPVAKAPDGGFTALASDTTVLVHNYLLGLPAPHYVTSGEMMADLTKRLGASESTIKRALKDDQTGLVCKRSNGRSTLVFHAQYENIVERRINDLDMGHA